MPPAPLSSPGSPNQVQSIDTRAQRASAMKPLNIPMSKTARESELFLSRSVRSALFTSTSRNRCSGRSSTCFLPLLQVLLNCASLQLDTRTLWTVLGGAGGTKREQTSGSRGCRRGSSPPQRVLVAPGSPLAMGLGRAAHPGTRPGGWAHTVPAQPAAQVPLNCH